MVQSRKRSYRSAGGNGIPWVLLSIKDFCLPAMLDSGPSVPFVIQDVLEKIKELIISHTAETTEKLCQAANGEPCSSRTPSFF
jgi:hypothetical protein